jgi:peroxiredoxin Q/BCP
MKVMLLTEKAHKCNAGKRMLPEELFSLTGAVKGSGKGAPFGTIPNCIPQLAITDVQEQLPGAMKSTLFTLFLFTIALTMSTTAKAELKVGDNAPNVTGINETGQKLSFGDVYAKQPYTLVYFFPKADTPGCTAQGCSLRDAYEDLTKKGVVVLGVSLDGADAQKAFKEKYHFPFTLIADPDQTVVNAFGVKVKSMLGMGSFATREAFLIKDGKIVWADYSAKTSKQAEDVLKVLASQGG